MTEKLKEIIKERDFLIPKMLFLNYKKIGLTEKELIFIIYVLNTNSTFNPKQISNELNISLTETMGTIEELEKKGIIKLEIKKIGNIRNEYINIEGLYEKIIFKIIEHQPKEENKNIYEIFEKEFGRPITSIECEIIGAWIENGTAEETIILALKEAIYNGVSNLRYIDKIISEWSKKGIKTKEDVEKSRINYKKTKETKQTNEILSYDWLNDK